MKKKKFLAIGLVVTFLMTIILNAFLSAKEDTSELSELTLANIEALAHDEKPDENTCTIIGYKEIWDRGCLYNCAQCAEGFFVPLYVIRCNAR